MKVKNGKFGGEIIEFIKINNIIKAIVKTDTLTIEAWDIDNCKVIQDGYEFTSSYTSINAELLDMVKMIACLNIQQWNASIRARDIIKKINENNH